jgi:hypothetical protein
VSLSVCFRDLADGQANKHRLTRTTSADRQRKFPDELSIHQAASLSMFVYVYGPGLCEAHALLHDERITVVGSPLLVERGDSPLPTFGNDIANPLGVYRARSTATFSARYQPVRQRVVFWQVQRPKRRLIGDEFDRRRYVLKILPSLIEVRLVPRWSRQDHSWPPTLARLSSLMALWHT